MGKGYFVFDGNGKVVYTPASSAPTLPDTPDVPPIQPITPATKYSDVMIGSSSKDERGQYRGG
jgi:hypothetical protein